MCEWEGDSSSWGAVLLLWVCFWMSLPVQGKSLAVFLQTQWLVSIQRKIITVSWMLCMCGKRGGHRYRGFCSRQKEARWDIWDHLNTHFCLPCFIWRGHSCTPKCLLHIKAGVCRCESSGSVVPHLVLLPSAQTDFISLISCLFPLRAALWLGEDRWPHLRQLLCRVSLPTDSVTSAAMEWNRKHISVVYKVFLWLISRSIRISFLCHIA